MKKRRLIKLLLSIFLIASWTLAGWPAIWLKPRIPPRVHEIKAATNTETFTSAGSGTWTAPPGVTSVDVETWGGGGAGGQRTTNGCGGGGGGGAYAKKTVTVVPGTGYTRVVGAAGVTGNPGTHGGNSTFNTTSVVAAGGKTVAQNTATGGVGGLTANSTGDTIKDGGSGFTCTSTGGGGGGSGGTAANGNTATSSTGASAVAGGGPGGNGRTSSQGNGSAPASGPGGGGGGAYRTSSSTRTGGAGYAGQIKLTYTIYTVLGNGTDGSNSTIGPGASATEIDRFSFVDSYGTDTVTGLTITLGPTDAFNNVATVDVQTTGGTSKCSNSSISSNTVTLSNCAIAVTTTLTEYKIMITPKTHANMPAVPGASYATTATITDWTCTNTHGSTTSDSGSAIVTIDNASPSNVTSASGSAGIEQVALSWTNPADSDFSQNVVLRQANSAVSDTPVEGTTYSVGNTIGSSTIACVTATTGCTDTNVTGETPYHYKIFAKDTNGNYSQNGIVPTGSPFTPTAKVISVTITSSENNPFDYGVLPLSTTKSTVDLSKTQTAQNSGNVAEDFNIKTSNATGGTQWNLGSSAGSNVFVHEYCKSGGTWYKFATADVYEAAPLVTNMAVDGTQNFDLRITVPSSTSDYQQKTVVVTVQAIQH